jgi:hypothetical protein
VIRRWRHLVRFESVKASLSSAPQAAAADDEQRCRRHRAHDVNRREERVAVVASALAPDHEINRSFAIADEWPERKMECAKAKNQEACLPEFLHAPQLPR